MVSTHYRVELECRHAMTFYTEFDITMAQNDFEEIKCKYCKEYKAIDRIVDYIEVFD